MNRECMSVLQLVNQDNTSFIAVELGINKCFCLNLFKTYRSILYKH